MGLCPHRLTEAALPPNQVWGKKFVIYAALGVPRINPNSWRLKVDGLVNTPLEYTYAQLTSVPQDNLTRSFHCLVPGSIVYANPEPKRIEEIKLGDYIIGEDGLKHKVRKLIRMNHRGRVVGIKASYLPPVIVTPEHPVLTIKAHPGVGKSRSKRRQRTFRDDPSPVWCRADELSLGDYVFFPKYRQISNQEFVRIGSQRFRIDERLASVLGWYVAEGSGADSEGRGVAFSLSNEDDVEDIKKLRSDLSELFGAKTSIYGNQKGTLRKVVITSSKARELSRTLKLWCGDEAESKKIPDFILNSKKPILRSFLNSYFKGDGYSPIYTGKKGRHIDFIDDTTSSQILAYQLILAFSKLEIPAGVVNHPGSVKDGFSIRVRGDKVKLLISDFPSLNKINKFHYWETPDGFYYPIRKIWEEDYRGTVYDFQAPGYTMLSPFVTQDCVTRWSIKDVAWEGLQLRKLIEPAGVSPEASWLMFHCADGYTAPVPLEDALKEDSILAFKLNGKPLSAEQGFPARPFIPGLYAWKSAKWVNRMELLPDYSDGYWETYGYHERADVWEEERFKGHKGTPVKRRAFGTA
jgi:DMSO/TMAO reductase YedYZ molybdopterin-dependent catalytic subunit